MNSLLIALRSAEEFGDLDGCAVLGKWFKAEDVTVFEREDTEFGVLIKQSFEYLACLSFVLAKIVARLDVVRPFATRERFLIVRYVTDDIEDICVGEVRIRAAHFFDEDIVVFEVLDDLSFARSVCPYPCEIGELRETREDTFAGEVEEVGNLERLTVIVDDIVYLMQFGDALAALDMDFLQFVLGHFFSLNLGLLACACSAFGGLVVIFLLDLNLGFAIELRVEEEAGRITEIEYLEMTFVDLAFLVDIDTRTATDHLLEESHGVNLFVDDDESAGLTIDTC